MGRDPEAVELRAVAPVVVAGSPTELVAPVLFVSNGARVVGVTSAERLRPFHGKPLAILTKLDGSASHPVSTWGMGRYSGVGLVEIEGQLPSDHDLVVLPIGNVCATVETRGSPAGLVTIVPSASGKGFQRELVPIYVDNDDGGGMSDTVARIASPIEDAHAKLAAEGLTAFAWFPPDPALGRKREVLAVGVAYPYRGVAKPRPHAVFAELVALDDLGRALLGGAERDARPDPAQVAGEIEK